MSTFFNKPSDPSKSIFSNPPGQNAPNSQNPNPNPSNNMFGAVKPGPSIFANTSAAPAMGGGIFGNPGNATGNITTSSTPPAPSSSPFGGSLFGSSTANPPTTTPAITSTTPTGGLQFGAGPGAAPSTTTTTTTTGATGSTPSLFGNAPKPAGPPASGSLFSGGPTTSATGVASTMPAPPSLGSTGTNPTTPASGSLFGTTPTKPADNAAPKSSIFGTTIGTTTSTVPASMAPAQTTGLFRLPTKPTESTSTVAQGPTPQPVTGTTTAPTGATGTTGTVPGANLFGGGSLFSKTPAAPATSTTPAASSTTPSLFDTKAEEKKDGSTAAPTPGLSLFGAAKTPTVAPAAPSTNAAANAKPAVTTTPGTSVAVAPPSMLKGKTLEEIVNRWSSDLETYVREFSVFAAEVTVWDRALIENGNDLCALNSHILAAERQQDTIDQSLTHIEQQQRDLAATLDSYENLSQELLGGQGGSLRTLDTGPADTERDKNYMLAADLQTQLDDLSEPLTQMIDAVNALSASNKSNGESNNDPVSQISQILGNFLESLQWIENSVREVEGKVGDVERRIKGSGHSLSGSTNHGKPRGFGLGR